MGSLSTGVAVFYMSWVIASLILLSVGESVGSWQKPSQERLMIFRSPKIGRAGMVSLSLWIFSLPVLFAALGAYSPRSYVPTGRFGYSLLVLLYFCMAYGLAALLVWATPPQETQIDLDQRACLHRRGWGRQQKTWSFSLEEISAVCVSFRNSGNSIYLNPIPQENQPLRLTLGHFPVNGFSPMGPKALAFAQEIAETLELPVHEVSARVF